MIKRLALTAPTALIIVALASTTATAQIPSFAEVTGALSEERAREEARRCMICGQCGNCRLKGEKGEEQ